jgi:hypothetical protein
MITTMTRNHTKKRISAPLACRSFGLPKYGIRWWIAGDGIAVRFHQLRRWSPLVGTDRSAFVGKLCDVLSRPTTRSARCAGQVGTYPRRGPPMRLA